MRNVIATRIIFIISISSFLIGCGNTRNLIQVECRSLKSFRGIVLYDFDKCENLHLDSLQYRDFLLSYSDTSDKVVEGMALLEKCYKFNYGLVMIVVIDSKQYEVITLVDPNSTQVDKLVHGRKYQMKIKPYFYQAPNHFASEFRREIYIDHYVIIPPYLLHDEAKICTANFKDIVL